MSSSNQRAASFKASALQNINKVAIARDRPRTRRYKRARAARAPSALARRPLPSDPMSFVTTAADTLRLGIFTELRKPHRASPLHYTAADCETASPSHLQPTTDGGIVLIDAASRPQTSAASFCHTLMDEVDEMDNSMSPTLLSSVQASLDSDSSSELHELPPISPARTSITAGSVSSASGIPHGMRMFYTPRAANTKVKMPRSNANQRALKTRCNALEHEVVFTVPASVDDARPTTRGTILTAAPPSLPRHLATGVVPRPHGTCAFGMTSMNAKPRVNSVLVLRFEPFSAASKLSCVCGVPTCFFRLTASG